MGRPPVATKSHDRTHHIGATSSITSLLKVDEAQRDLNGDGEVDILMGAYNHLAGQDYPPGKAYLSLSGD